MNLKDKIPAKNSKLNISDKFLRPDRVSYIIDYPNVITYDNTITKGITYTLFNSRDSELTMNLVQITDAYYDGYVLSLIFQDLESPRNIHVEFDIFKEPTTCSWMLIDLPYLQEKIDMIAVNDFCGCK
jgi:hypothetical protein